MLNPTMKTTRILTKDNHLLIVQKMSASELLSCAILDINSTYSTIPRNANIAITHVINTLSRSLSPAEAKGPKVFDRRTTIKRLRKRTGIAMQRFNCCRRSCMCFVGPHSLLTHCSWCNEERYRDIAKKIPWKTYDYIPLIHRLRLQMGDPQRAKVL